MEIIIFYIVDSNEIVHNLYLTVKIKLKTKNIKKKYENSKIN